MKNNSQSNSEPFMVLPWDGKEKQSIFVICPENITWQSQTQSKVISQSHVGCLEIENICLVTIDEQAAKKYFQTATRMSDSCNKIAFCEKRKKSTIFCGKKSIALCRSIQNEKSQR